MKDFLIKSTTRNSFSNSYVSFTGFPEEKNGKTDGLLKPQPRVSLRYKILIMSMQNLSTANYLYTEVLFSCETIMFDDTKSDLFTITFYLCKNRVE